jgi:hypothetical protein
MGLIHASEQKNLQFAVGSINRCANLAGLSQLTDADVTGRANLAALIAQIEVRKGKANPADQHEFEAVENWVTWLQGTGNLSDTTIAALTNVRTSGNSNELRFNFFTLVNDGLFTDPTYADTLTSHPNIFP